MCINSGLSTETSGGIRFEIGRADRKLKTYSERRDGGSKLRSEG